MANSNYKQRKDYFNGFLTLFGRKPVLEALTDEAVSPARLHLADSNRDSAELQRMKDIAARRNVEILFHSKRELSRISRNGRQDQGVAIDIEVPHYRPLSALIDDDTANVQVLAVDQVTNPQNLGMVIRSVGASPMRGLLLARNGNARVDGLVIKASAGTLFKTAIFHCDELGDALVQLKASGFRIFGLDGDGPVSLPSVAPTGKLVFVLGNETTGLSSKTRGCCDAIVRIPLSNGIESLNVGVAASLVAFRSIFSGSA